MYITLMISPSHSRIEKRGDSMKRLYKIGKVIKNLIKLGAGVFIEGIKFN